MDTQKTKAALEKKGYTVSVFPTKRDAADYLWKTVRGSTVGFGGSATLAELELKHVLSDFNTVYVRDVTAPAETYLAMTEKAAAADYYFLSANAVSDEGEIVNIDGAGNRVAGALYGHKKVYYIVGANKIGGTLEEAVRRARNTAAPKNALRLHRKTPCALAVQERLEAAYREKYGAEEIDQLKWQEFLAGLSEEELGTKCYDCKSPERICRSLSILLMNTLGADVEVVIVEEPLGY